MPKDPDVDAWFEKRKPPLEPAMQRVREIILGTDPRIEESIKWSTPTFSFNGNIASFAPAKKFVSLLFHRGAEIPGRHRRLEGEGAVTRTMRFADLEDVETSKKQLEAVIRAWYKWKSDQA
jgi:hypothetical protein